MNLGDVERIEDAGGVGDQHVEAVFPIGRNLATVTVCVVAQHAIVPLQYVGEFVPHGQVGGEPVAEHDLGAFLGVDAAVEGRSVAVDLHGSPCGGLDLEVRNRLEALTPRAMRAIPIGDRPHVADGPVA
jgi:hypothetical protein